MSYIYEALKKAEDEHKRGAVAVRPTGRRTLFGARPPWWLWALIGVLGANVIALATLAITLGYRWPGTRTPGEGTATARPVSASRAEGERPPDASTRVVPAPVTPATSPAASASPPPAGASGAAPSAGRVAAVASPAPKSAPAPNAAAASAGTPAGSAGVATALPSGVPPTALPSKIVPPAARVAPPAAIAPAPAPARGESAAPGESGRGVASPRVERQPAVAEPRVDQNPRTAAGPPETRAIAPETRPADASAAPPVEPPRVTLQVIVYSEVPSQRMVFIDGHRYAEGDSLDAETVLERINADGVVFKRRGVRFVIADRRE